MTAEFQIGQHTTLLEEKRVFKGKDSESRDIIITSLAPGKGFELYQTGNEETETIRTGDMIQLLDGIIVVAK